MSEAEHGSSPFTDEKPLVQPAMQLPNMAELLPLSALAFGQEEEKDMPGCVEGMESGQHDSAILSVAGQAGQAGQDTSSSSQLHTPGPLCPSQFSL